MVRTCRGIKPTYQIRTRSFGSTNNFSSGFTLKASYQASTFRITPLTDLDAHEMVRGIRGYRLLEGYRGHAPADIHAIEEVLLRISRMVENIPEIRELDLNPLFAMQPGKGCVAVDARIRVAS